MPRSDVAVEREFSRERPGAVWAEELGVAVLFAAVLEDVVLAGEQLRAMWAALRVFVGLVVGGGVCAVHGAIRGVEYCCRGFAVG